MVIYNKKMMTVNNIKITKKQNIILYNLITREIMSIEELDKLIDSDTGNRTSSVHIFRLRKRIGHLIEIKTRVGAGFYIKDKSRIKINQGGVLKSTGYEDYKLELKDYIYKMLDNFKKDVIDAEKRLKESLEDVL